MIGSQSLSIAFVALGFPPDVGGTELYNVEYARRLYARGHDLKVLTWESESEGQQEADAALPFEVARLPYRRRRKQLEAGGVDEALAAWAPSVAFVSRGSRIMPRVVAAVARRAPVVLSIHELREKHRGRNALDRWRVRRRYGLDRAASVTVNSQDTRRRVLDLGVAPERVAMVYPGVDIERFSPDAEAGLRLRAQLGFGERPILLTVSRLAANKGHAQVIAALPKLRACRRDLLYVIVGRGGMRAELEGQAKALGVSDMVHFAGLVDDVRDYYHACDVYAMVSTPQSERANAGEGFGIAYVEAGACERPVIASSSGGGAEIVDDGVTGRVVAPHDAEALIAAIEELLSNPQRRRELGRAARARVERFDWRHGAEALEAALRAASVDRA
jgi:phosphatidyl-myo-inositol dimannoside synthase